MEHYVTLLDSTFLPQGLALCQSLERHAGIYTLWILCVDQEAHGVLTKLDLPSVRLIDLADVETPELRSVRAGRTPREYCWTLTPFAPRFVFEAERSVERVTYLDADVWLLKDPDPIFRELDASGKQVLLTDHGYAPEYDSSATAGQYCVQFMTFTRAGSQTAGRWWEKRCVEWCFARFEDGRFGDQKYLDDWPTRFARDVHVLQHQEWTLAPWNAGRFPYGNAILYHFQGLGLLKGSRVTLADRAIPAIVIRQVYEPYLEALRWAIGLLRQAGFEPRPQQRSPGLFGTARRILAGAASQRWRFNVRHVRAL